MQPNAKIVLVAVIILASVAILAVPDIVNCQVDLGQYCTQYDASFNCISYSHSYVAGKTTEMALRPSAAIVAFVPSKTGPTA
jgi:hypothetical protein